VKEDKYQYWVSTIVSPNLKRYLVLIAIVAGAQFGAGRLGDILQTINNGGIGPVWPAAGVALGALLVYGDSVWLGIAVGAFLLARVGHLSYAAASAYAAATTLAPLFAASLLRRVVNFDRSLSRLSDALGLIVFGALGSGLISASMGVPVLYVAYARSWSAFSSAWLVYFLGDSTGVLLVTPLVLTLPGLVRLRGGGRILELASLLLLLTATCFLVFGDAPLFPIKLHALALAVLPFVMWAAIRFGVGATVLSIFIVAALVTLETALGAGPFASNTPFINAVLLALFFALISVTGLTLAVVVAEREQLVRRQAASQMRLRLATIVESSKDAIISASLDGVIESWNASAQQIFGFTEAEAIGQPITILIPPELRDEQKNILERLRKGERIEDLETVRLSKIGEKVDVLLTVFPIRDETGRVVGASASIQDVTQRKRADEALSRSEQKFAKAFRQSPLLLTITSAKDHRYIDVNVTFETITGWRRDEVLGRTPLDIGIWVDPTQKVEFAKRVLAAGSVRDREVLYRCRDGIQRWGLGAAELIEVDHEPCILSVLADITERKRAEEALSAMGRKLLEAQEQERKRIGRDLHDDIGQRLALLAIQLEQVQQAYPDSLLSRIEEIRKGVLDVSNTVQTMSHELHSSKLEYLGIVAAVRSFCREFGERHRVEVDFRTHDLPNALPSEIALCVFRVLQEALQNAAKHSGVGHFEVELWGTSDQIHLTVKDLGVGFSTEVAMKGTGLGLTSMQERLRLLNGTLSIESQPKHGTTIHVRVPFPSPSDSAQAVGY
jgi:PAS domain S-box-containing protein